jgi:tRNA threonylcarbamoyladenosine biosynthesis protein TsaE
VITFRTHSSDDTRTLAGVIARLARERDIILLCGNMGSGKTTFAQGFARGLGVAEAVVSPTYTLVREYAARLRLHHVDVYRLDHHQEVIDLGLNEMLDDGGVTLIEWGDVAEPLLPRDYLQVHLELTDDPDVRLVSLSATGSPWAGRDAELRRAVTHWVER